MTHVGSIVHGIGASLAFGALFYLAGLVLTPRRWDSPVRDATWPVLGAALYVLLCWVAISAQRIPLTVVTSGFAGGLVLLSVLRIGRVAGAAKSRIASRTAAAGVAIFALFYVLAYALALPHATDLYLPAGPGGLDLLTQVRYAKQLLLFGSPNLESATFDYLRNPGVSYLLAGFSLAYGRDPLSATLSARFALVALSALAAIGACRSIFHLSISASMVIACILVTSSHVMNAADVCDFTTLATLPILLYLVRKTLEAGSGRVLDAPLTASFAGAYLLLFFMDPFALATALGTQAVILIPIALGRRVGGIGVSALAAVTIVALPFVDRVEWSFANVAWSNALTAAALALAVTVLAAAAYLVGREDLLGRLARTQEDRRLTVALAGYVAIALIAGNVALHAGRAPVVTAVPREWRGLADLDALPFGELTLKVDRDPGGLLAAVTRYILPTRKVHVAGPGVRPRDLPFDTISRQSPMLIQNLGCDGVGHADTIGVSGLGCLLFAPPSLNLDTFYPFNRAYLFVEFDGMTNREGGGRWNTGTTLPVKLMADPERARIDRDLYVNFSLHAFLPPGGEPRRLNVRWGAGRTGDTTVANEALISIPVASGDWTGNRVWSLPISIDFPDRVTLLFHELSVTESALGRLVQ